MKKKKNLPEEPSGGARRRELPGLGTEAYANCSRSLQLQAMMIHHQNINIVEEEEGKRESAVLRKEDRV